MSILITGGAGYIGSHACVELLNAGYETIVLDNFSNSKPESLNRISKITDKTFKFYDVDLLDKEKVEQVFIENDIEAVIHCAGLKDADGMGKLPLSYYYNDITGTIILCEMMKRYNIKKLVYSSSATVYGMPEHFPITENAPLFTINSYGRTKIMIEEILRDLYFSDPSWSIALLHYYHPIGAHKSGTIGEVPNETSNNLIDFIIQTAIGKRKELNVFGNEYPTLDGTVVRDYIHVVDLAVGHLRALEKVLTSSGVDSYNLGIGKGYSVLQMVAAFEKASGVKIPYKIVAPRPDDAPICFVDPTKARTELGWKAKMEIEEMCEDTWRWLSMNPNGYESKIDSDEKISVFQKNGDFLVET